MNIRKCYFSIGLLLIVLLNVAGAYCFFRVDLTADKRYTISAPTKHLMEQLDAPLSVTVYLDGNLNTGFLRLKRATVELLEELDVYAGQSVSYKFVNPSENEDVKKRTAVYEALVNKGMTPTMIHERDRDGKMTQEIIFPWAEISYKNKTQTVCLLKNIRGNSGDDNLNISVETLEFELTDAIRLLMKQRVEKVAFIEGHGELGEANTYDISRALSRYYQIDRGVLGNDPTVLNDYKAIIIADPQLPFSESDKYIIDQYVMRGGRVLWLLNGVRFDSPSLSTMGMSPAIPLDLNLTDMLFRYGVRIAPVLLQDEQCLPVPVNMAQDGASPDFQPMPWYFAPLLLTSQAHAVSRNVAQVSGTFVSRVEWVGDAARQRRDVLLASSNATHLIPTPASINVSEVDITDDYFNVGYVPVGVAIDGIFESLFAHRMVPEVLPANEVVRSESVPTRQIVIAGGSIISNEMEEGQALPVGYDRYTQTQFGNRDFLINAVLYLADDEGWISLRNKELTLRMLNKNITRQHRHWYQWLNVGLPLVLLALFGCCFTLWRKRKYTH